MNGKHDFKPGDVVQLNEEGRNINNWPLQYSPGGQYVVKEIRKSKFGDDMLMTVHDDKGSTTNGLTVRLFEHVEGPW